MVDGEIDKELVESFLKELIKIEEQPSFMYGGQETVRREKIQNLLEKFVE